MSNYVSKTDPVYLTDVIANGFICGPDSEYVDMLKKHWDQIIFLTPHPDAKAIDHDFQSPTFLPKIKEHIDQYLNQVIKK